MGSDGNQDFEGKRGFTFRCVEMASNSTQASGQGREFRLCQGEFDAHSDVEGGQSAEVSSDGPIGVST